MAEWVMENVYHDEAVAILGNRDENVRLLRDVLGLKIVARNDAIQLLGLPEQVVVGRRVLDHLRKRYLKQEPTSAEDVKLYLSSTLNGGDGSESNGVPANGAATAGGKTASGAAVLTPILTPMLPLSVPASDRPRLLAPPPMGAAEIVGPMRKLHARSAGQTRYVESIRAHDLTFGVGPAGTGKTYLAVAAALEYLAQRRVKRIVLVRPAVEAGEKLGFLPGDPQAKVNPFLRPLFDALREMLDLHQMKNYLDHEVIEIQPLAYMRGRTLNDAFVILDEAQNTTVPQMKMFLTRMGIGSKVVVAGDVTQTDLPAGVESGLADAVERLSKVEKVGVVRMERQDVVRHPLVEAILNAYDDTLETARSSRAGGVDRPAAVCEEPERPA
ncbi:MAG: PhoH family protein [Planctomycetia bacterium]